MLRADMSPKPVYEQLKQLIHEEWKTRVSTTTDAKGRILVPGILRGVPHGDRDAGRQGGAAISASQGWTDGDRDSSGRVQGSLMLLIEFLLSRKELLIHDGGRNSPGPSREYIRLLIRQKSSILSQLLATNGSVPT